MTSVGAFKYKYKSSACANFDDYVKLEKIKNIRDFYEMDKDELLGEGSFGKVYKCKHKKFDVVYAVKTVNKKDMDEDTAK